jgi:acyl-CoA synthetase (NDP forming)
MQSLQQENKDGGESGIQPAFLTEYEGTSILAKYHFPVAEGKLAATESEAVSFARELSYPVVMKLMSPDIIHKSDAGCVLLNIRSDEEAKTAFDTLYLNAARYKPSADIHGVLVQRMFPKGLELIVGVKRDPVFGHMITVGAGGVLVELLHDFSTALVPVTRREAEEMLHQLKIYPLLNGYRGAEILDQEAVIQLILQLNDLCIQMEEISELDLNPVFVYEQGVRITDVRILMETKEAPKSLRITTASQLDAMFNPRSIAVVGASSNIKKNGGRLVHYLLKHGYTGKLYPVNPGSDEIMGHPCFPDISSIPDEVDLACLIVRADLTPALLEECARKGVKAAIIYSSGFAEIGEQGRLLQEQVLAAAEKGGIRLCGPNSIGIASPNKKIYTAFGMALQTDKPLPGNIGFVSQSGAMGSSLLSRAWEQGVGFSRWISVGNEADMTIPDFIKFLVNDPDTSVISCFIEGIQNGRSFLEAAQKAKEARKPLIVYKTGRSTEGQRAVQSHTGAIAGNDQAYKTAFKKSSVIQVENVGELIDVSKAFMQIKSPRGRRMGIVTASGGACSVVADECSLQHLEVPVLSQETQRVLSESIPPFGAVQNPVDVTAELLSKPEMFKQVLQAVSADPSIDAIIVMLTTSADPIASVVAKAIVEVRNDTDKPIVVGRLGADFLAPQALEYFHQHNVPIYVTPDRVVKVMKYLVDYGEMLDK